MAVLLPIESAPFRRVGLKYGSEDRRRRRRVWIPVGATLAFARPRAERRVRKAAPYRGQKLSKRAATWGHPYGPHPPRCARHLPLKGKARAGHGPAPRPCLKNVNMPRRRVFSRHTALIFLAIHQTAGLFPPYCVDFPCNTPSIAASNRLAWRKNPSPLGTFPIFKQGLRREMKLTRWFGKVRRRSGAAESEIFAHPGPSGPGGEADCHSDFACRKCSAWSKG